MATGCDWSEDMRAGKWGEKVWGVLALEGGSRGGKEQRDTVECAPYSKVITEYKRECR